MLSGRKQFTACVYGFYSPGNLTQDDDTYLARFRSSSERMVEAGYDYVMEDAALQALNHRLVHSTNYDIASCMTHGRIRRSMTFSVVYKDRHASDHRCFWMRWIEPADCRLTAETTHAMTTLCIGTSVSDASSSAYAASLPACTASFVLATPCIKKPGHDSVHRDRDCDGLRCDPLDSICLLSCNELWPASMLGAVGGSVHSATTHANMKIFGTGLPGLAVGQPQAMLKLQHLRLPVRVQDDRPCNSDGKLGSASLSLPFPLPPFRILLVAAIRDGKQVEDYFGVNLQVIPLGIQRQVACTVLAKTLSEDLCQPEPGCSVGLQDLLEAGGHEACHGLLFKKKRSNFGPCQMYSTRPSPWPRLCAAGHGAGTGQWLHRRTVRLLCRGQPRKIHCELRLTLFWASQVGVHPDGL